MPVVQKGSVAKSLPKPGPAADAETPKVSSKADLFNQKVPEVGGKGLKDGNYQAYLVGAEFQKKNEEGDQRESVQFTYEVAEGEFEGRTQKTWYNIFDKDGNLAQGVDYLKNDMEALGQPALDYDELEEQLRQLESERILCNIRVATKKGYSNIYLQGMAV